MLLKATLLGFAALVGSAAISARAASLQVQPALLDVTAPGSSSTVTLRNPSARPLNVQLRVFKWSQSNGQDVLEPTTDVVASPPAVTLAAGVDYVARVVRVRKDAIEGEEAYRLLVDELPDGAPAQNTSIRLLVRHSIPVFFSSVGRSPARIAWSLRRQDGRVVLSATNTGAMRLRLSEVVLTDRGGRQVAFGKGLLGYALGHSTMRWTAPASSRDFGSGGPVAISAKAADGPLNAAVQIDGR